MIRSGMEREQRSANRGILSENREMTVSDRPEVWLRGPVDGVEPLLMPIVHALLQVEEDLTALVPVVATEHVWLRPGGAASIGFHVRHTGGALDRLLTYARGEMLSPAQKQFLQTEEAPGDPPDTLHSVSMQTVETIRRSLQQVRLTPTATLAEPRRVGRAGLPTTVFGLLVHAAEHSTRHAGQAITTARILRGWTR
jgi:hypothetical protein